MPEHKNPHGSNAGPTPKSDGQAEVLPDLMRRTLDPLLAHERSGQTRNAALRLALRDICDRARDDGLRAEELLLVLKDAWQELQQRRGLPRVDTDAALASVVSACIDEYYQSPPVRRDVAPGRALRPEGDQVRVDLRGAEIR